jgi:hypothetical protein
MAAPVPCAAPVTIATLPSSLPVAAQRDSAIVTLSFGRDVRSTGPAGSIAIVAEFAQLTTSGLFDQF